MKRNPCGRDGFTLPQLGLGCWSFGGGAGDYWGAVEAAGVDRMISTALENDVDYFDTAPMYNDGRSEEALGQALRGRRDQALIGTKFPPEDARPDRLPKACEDSLRRLGTDRIDLYMIHWPVPDDSLEEVLGILVDLKTQGKIRQIGVSNYGIRDLTRATDLCPDIVVNQMHYNLLSRAVETGIMPLCRECQVGVMAYMPLLQGILSGKYESADAAPANRVRTRHFRGDRPMSRHEGPGAEAEVFDCVAELRKAAEETGLAPAELALAWLAAKGTACILAGARNETQLAANIRGAEAELPDEITARLDAASQPVLDLLGSGPDYWESDANSRIH